MYYAITSNGWKRSSSIDGADGQYLQNAVKNGDAYLYKLNSNGSWDLDSTNGSNSSVSEVADDAAAKKAEAKFNSENSRIQYKEKTIDLKMNNLDTERAAITTQSESVKKMIDKNVEVFKMFQNA